MMVFRKEFMPRSLPPLNPMQRRFVEEYLIDLNATQAAIRAGYSKKNAGKIGPRLRCKPQIETKENPQTNTPGDRLCAEQEIPIDTRTVRAADRVASDIQQRHTKIFL